MDNRADSTNTTGWHADPGDPTITRYWDGTTWTGERRWNGREWADVAAPAAHAAAGPPAVAPYGGAGAAPTGNAAVAAVTSLPRAAQVLFGGAIALAVCIFFPIVSIESGFGSADASLSSDQGAGVFMLVLAAAAFALSWPARERVLTTPRLGGLGAVFAFCLLAVISNVSDLGEVQAEARSVGMNVSAGFGLYLWAASTAALGTGIVLAWRDRQAAA